MDGSNGDNGDKQKSPRKTWRRVTLSVFGILIVVLHWRWAVNHLYSLPEHSISAFTSITTAAFYVVGVITVFLVTGLTFFSWTQSSNIAASISEQINTAISKFSRQDPPDNK